MSTKELSKKMQEERDRAYRAYREAELTADAKGLSYFDGVLSGMDIIIKLVKEAIEER